MDYAQYAIWWVPQPGTALARFGATWTGWCPDRGMTGTASARAAMPRGWAGVPGSVARHGLHAKLTLPFRLSAARLWRLQTALDELAERTPAIRLPQLSVRIVDRRLALSLGRPDMAVARLFSEVGDAVLAPLTQPSLARFPGAAGLDRSLVPERGSAAVGSREPARFHLPLSDRLEVETARQAAAELEPMIAGVVERRWMLSELALVGDPGGGRPWRVIDRYSLRREAAVCGARLPDGMVCMGPVLLAPFERRSTLQSSDSEAGQPYPMATALSSPDDRPQAEPARIPARAPAGHRADQSNTG